MYSSRRAPSILRRSCVDLSRRSRVDLPLISRAHPRSMRGAADPQNVSASGRSRWAADATPPERSLVHHHAAGENRPTLRMPSAQLRELVVSLSSPRVEPPSELPIELPIELGPAVTAPPSAASSASFASAPELDASLDD